MIYNFMKKIVIIISIIILITLSISLSFAQIPGMNKVNDRQFDWMTYKTNHFIIYYYPEASNMVRAMGDMAEVAYAKMSDILEHEVKKKIPLILYKSHADFRQTNVTTETLTEGVGGFTELLKYRVVIPFTGSMDQFQKVITHEVNHVFEFDMLYKNTLAHIYTGEFLYSPPIWFLEGMSEYMADDWDAEGEMVLKDAIITNSIVPLTLLQDFGPMGSRVYLGYKEGQSAITYLVDKYGIDKLSELLRELSISRTKDINDAFKNAIGIEFEKFNKEWEEFIKKRYLPEIAQKQSSDSIGTNITEKNNSYSNVRPVWSPSGDLIAYITSTDSSNEIRIVSVKDGKLFTKINENDVDDGYESIRESGTGLAWSPDGDKIAFVAIKNDRDFLAVVNVVTKKMIKKIEMSYDVVYSPTWSPDNEQIAFIGLKDGRSDIYILTLKDGSITQITTDTHEERSVSWHPTEPKLVYSAERNYKYKLFIMDLRTHQSQQITCGTQNDVSPSWTSDGKKVVFCSDTNGIYDIYSIDLDNLDPSSPPKTVSVTKLTNIITGCFSPVFSPDQTNLAISVFHDYKSDVYILKAKELINEKVTFADINITEESLYTLDEKPIKGVKSGLNFSPDMIYVDFGYTSGGFLQNTMQFIASDMMGDHRFMTSFDAVSLYSQPDFFTAYYYLRKRPDFGVALYNWNQYYTQGGESFNQRSTGIQGYMSYPINKFNRIDIVAGRELRFFDSGSVENSINNNKSGPLNDVGISFVKDNVIWNEYGPFSGTSAELSIDQTIKLTEHDRKRTEVILNTKEYIKLGKRTNLAIRVIGAGSFGIDKENYYLGSSFNQSQGGLSYNESMMRGYDFDEIFGTRVGLLNLEIRIPFIDELRFGWPVPWGFSGIRGVLFTDFAGVFPRPPNAKDIYGKPILYKKQFEPYVSDKDGFRLADLRASVGLGFRLGPFSFDFAKKTDMQTFGKGYKFHFGIGSDF
jgi:Tol biopolymer transport system component